MKEWALKHPIATFLIIDSAITAVVKIATSIAGIFTPTKPETVPTEEVEAKEEEEE